MYITTYHKHNTPINYITYDTITNTNLAPTQIAKKKTIYIANPIPFENLPLNRTQHIAAISAYIHDMYIKGVKYYTDYFQTNSMQNLYYTFQIPKRSGGLRTINAPISEFKEYLKEMQNMFENIIKCLPHDNAYAYIKHRSTKDALQKHQTNNSKFYLKLDLKDFFTNCTPNLIYTKLLELYPFYYLTETTKLELKKLIQLCSLNNGLPQGTPMSPILTNLLMVSYDFHITNTLRQIDTNFIYTRYADDMLISNTISFNFQNIANTIQNIMQPFQIKQEKTRYGSNAGSNWNLGLMLNKDNQITIGHKKKRIINAMVHNFMQDFLQSNPWSRTDTEILQGQLSYLNQIEPNYYQYICNKYNNKFNYSIAQAIKDILTK